MDASIYDIEDLLLSAMKAEHDANNIYSSIANNIDNYLLQDKFRFLAGEEQRHYAYVEEVYKNHFPDKQVVLPEKTKVPLPEIEYNESTALSKLIDQAMDSEQAAREFYQAMASRFTDDSKIYSMLLYFADMELGHFQLLEIEKQAMQRFEEADVYWPMVHAGP